MSEEQTQEVIMKICIKCGEEKPITDYNKIKSNKDGIDKTCKSCWSKYNKEYRKINKDMLIARSKEYRIINKEKTKQNNKKYYQENKEEVRILQKEYYKKNKKAMSEQNKIWTKNNPEASKVIKKRYKLKNKEKTAAYHRNKRHTDVAYGIKCKLRCRINDTVRGKHKSAHTMELIGCSMDFLLDYLQSTAIKNGYKDFDINNYSGKEFHIDHIIPCASWNLECSYHQRLCFHWSNLQILSAEENLKKSDILLEENNNGTN